MWFGDLDYLKHYVKSVLPHVETSIAILLPIVSFNYANWFNCYIAKCK